MHAVVGDGCVVITIGSFTVKVACVDTAGTPQSPDTSQEYNPASAATRFAIERIGVVAPEILPATFTTLAPPFFH